jgi:sterol desaturase/sphingolipid hydroxylase (fatty acid hydroxylase superfamily)
MTTLAPPSLPPHELPPQHRQTSPPAQPTHPARRLSPWLFRIAAVAAVGVSLAIDLNVLVIVPLLFVLVVPFEKLFPRHVGQPLRRPLLGLDLRYALVTALTGVASVFVGIVIAVVSLTWVPALALRPLVAMLPSWAAVVLGIALFDLAVYWAHRWSHEVPALWRFHAVHHSTEHLDWVSGFRNHPLDGAIVAPPAVFLLVAGFDPELTGALAIVQLVTGIFLHANVRWRWRPLHRLVITPEFHHWHHAREREAHNSNYSVFLPVWDIVFGTYYMPRNKRPVRYGVEMDVPTTMRGQLAFPFAGRRPGIGLVRHPMRSVRAGGRVVRSILADVWRSTTRPRTSYARPGEPYPWASTPPRIPEP